MRYRLRSDAATTTRTTTTIAFEARMNNDSSQHGSNDDDEEIEADDDDEQQYHPHPPLRDDNHVAHNDNGLSGCCSFLVFRHSWSYYRWVLKFILFAATVVAVTTYLYIWRHYLSLIFLQPTTTTMSSSYNKHNHALKNNHHSSSSSAAAAVLEMYTKLRQEEESMMLQQHLPPWFLQYWEWHVHMRSSMIMLLNNNKNNITNNNTHFKFLIVSIRSQAAGGLADRLRSLPYYVWEASQTNRIFLMEWTRPCPMEELLVPPMGGIDWTIPHFLSTTSFHQPSLQPQQPQDDNHKYIWYQLNDSSSSSTSSSSNMMLHQQPHIYDKYTYVMAQPDHNSFVVGMTHLEQSILKINNHNNNHHDNSTSFLFWKYFYDLLITPSPPVQTMLDDTMKRMGLISSSFTTTTTTTTTSSRHNRQVPYNFDHPRPSVNYYWAIHLRARYPGSSPAFSKPKSFSWFSRGVDADGFQMTTQAQRELARLFQHAVQCLYYYQYDQNQHVQNDDNHTSTTTTNKLTNNEIPKLYFASDTNEAVRFITQEYSQDYNNKQQLGKIQSPPRQQQQKQQQQQVMPQQQQPSVVGLVTPYERFHLNRNDRIGGGIRKTPSVAFYPAIIDLWILKQASCMAIGKGGYGLLAARMGGVSCLILHQPNDFAATAVSSGADNRSSPKTCYA